MNDGSGVAGKVAQVLADTLRQHLEATETLRSEQSIRHRREQGEAWEAELAEYLHPLIDKIRIGSGTMLEPEDILDAMVAPSHLIELLFQLIGIIPLVAGSMNALVAPSISSVAQLAWKDGRILPLGVGDAVNAVTLGWLDEGTGDGKVAVSGVSPEDYQTLLAAAQQPLSADIYAELVRRGFQDTGYLRDRLSHTPLIDGAVDDLLSVLYAPMAPPDAVQAAVQSHLSLDEAKAKFAAGGADPDDFEVAYETAGEPPGNQQMLEYWNRGLVSEAQVAQSIAESRVKLKYIPAIMGARYKLPPLRSVTSFVTKGILSDSEAIQILQEDGYDAELSAKIVAAGHVTTTSAAKELAVGTITQLYEDQMITRADATSKLEQLGHNAGDCALILGLADHKIEAAAQKQLESQLRAKFLAGHLDATQVRVQLGGAGVPQAAIDQLIVTWTAEMGAKTKVLSEAQVIAATKKGVFSAAEAQRRLIAMGYDVIDARALLMTAGQETIPHGGLA